MEPTELPRAPRVVEDLALAAFRMVKEKLAFELDFTPDTLPVLDHYLRSLREDEASVPESVLGLVAPCAGAYFGEVIRRSLTGARWHCPEGDYPGWRLEMSHVFLWLNPIGAAIEAILDRSAEGWSAHLSLLPVEREVVEQSLASVGEVRADDFHRLAVRYEVVEQTLSVLETLALRRGETARTFGPDVYAAAAGEKPMVDA